MEDYAVGSGGDYSVYQGGAVHLNGTANCTIDHSLFDAVGGNAVFLTASSSAAMCSVLLSSPRGGCGCDVFCSAVLPREGCVCVRGGVLRARSHS